MSCLFEGEFFQNSLIYCHFRLKLRAMRLLRKHFIAKRRFQLLPNLKICSLLKIKENLFAAKKVKEIGAYAKKATLTSIKTFCFMLSLFQ